MAVFNFPVSDSNRKGMILTEVSSNNDIKITRFPDNTSAVITTLKTAPDPVVDFTGNDSDQADAAFSALLATVLTT